MTDNSVGLESGDNLLGACFGAAVECTAAVCSSGKAEMMVTPHFLWSEHPQKQILQQNFTASQGQKLAASSLCLMGVIAGSRFL